MHSVGRRDLVFVRSTGREAAARGRDVRDRAHWHGGDDGKQGRGRC